MQTWKESTGFDSDINRLIGFNCLQQTFRDVRMIYALYKLKDSSENLTKNTNLTYFIQTINKYS